MTATAPALDHFDVNGRGMAHCPAHEDRQRSLSVKEGKDGRALILCHAGCTFAEVIAAAGLDQSDAFAPDLTIVPADVRYDYHDADGNLVYYVLRKPNKQFPTLRPDGSAIGDTPRVPYRLPDLLAADPKRAVVIVEGEKDADRLRSLGMVATTSPGGAGKWRPELAEHFRGRRVVILPDNDEPGRKHAADVATSLRGIAREIKVVGLPDLPAKGDVSDYLDAGHTADELQAFIKTAPVEAAPAPRVVTLADVQPVRVEWLWPGYVPLGKVTLIDGDPGLGKSTLCMDLASRVSTGGQTPSGTTLPLGDVILLTNEDDAADTIRPRLDAAGADVSRIHHIRDLVLPDELAVLEAAVVANGVRLIVVDPLVGFINGKVKTYVDHEVRRALEPLASMAARHGCAIIGIRHLSKPKGNGSDAIYRGGGSVGFGGLARAVLAVGRDPQDPERFVLAAVKVNVAKRPPSIAYRLTADDDFAPARVTWEGETHLTAEDLIGRTQETAADTSKVADLAATITEIVTANGGEMLAKDGYRALEALDIETEGDAAKMLISRARKRAGITSGKVGMDGGWLWRLDRR
jgi:putative DNA primase/helicase